MKVQQLLKQRKERGFDLASRYRIVQRRGIWFVPSQNNPHKTYQVTFTVDGGKCTCEDYKERGISCKHIFAVDFVITKKVVMRKTAPIAKAKRITYPQDWPNYDKAQIQQKELFMRLLSGLCVTIPNPIPKATGRHALPLSTMLFVSALKVYTNFSLRRFMSDVKEAKEKGLIEVVPHFSMISYYMEKPELTLILKDLILTSSLPLKDVESSFSIDGSGFSPSKFSRWFDHKYGKVRDRRLFYKLHLVNGNATHIVTACEVTTQFVNDTVMLPQLAHDTHENFNVKEFCADKGYLSDTNLVYLDKLGVTSYIPFKESNVIEIKGIPRYHSETWKNAFNYFHLHQSAFLQHYHQRSNIETVFHMIKSKFGDYVRSRSETACINEILLKVLCHNICVLISEMFELGIKPEFLDS